MKQEATMTCRDAERAISARRDGLLPAGRVASLEAHLQSCRACREFQAALVDSAAAWKETAARMPVPDAGSEWRAIRRRLRPDEGSTRSGLEIATRRFSWFGVSLAAAALVALAGVLFFRGSLVPGKGGAPSAAIARAEYVEIADPAASPVVFVDEESGWLVVWTVPNRPAGGS